MLARTLACNSLQVGVCCQNWLLQSLAVATELPGHTLDGSCAVSHASFLQLRYRQIRMLLVGRMSAEAFHALPSDKCAERDSIKRLEHEVEGAYRNRLPGLHLVFGGS